VNAASRQSNINVFVKERRSPDVSQNKRDRKDAGDHDDHDDPDRARDGFE
jgi:hypothetical protein